MKTPLHRSGLPWVFAVLVATTGGAAQPRERPPVELPHPILFEVGDTEFATGDSIKIQSVRSSQPALTPGHDYSVSGTYSLGSKDEADLCLFVTTTNAEPTPIDPRQTLRITKGTGTFTLAQTMVPGYPHLSFYPVPGGSSFGGVYFGQGQTVLRDKKFSYLDSTPGGARAGGADLTIPATTAKPDQNRLIVEYIGEPVSAPANLAPAYSKEGLIAAVREAAKKAGITPRHIEIDDAEFPFIVGIIAGEGEHPKIREQFKQMADYEDQGGVSSSTGCAINITPWRVYPSATAQRISRRLTIRESMFYDRLGRTEAHLRRSARP